MINKSEAVASLRPEVEWTMYGDDVENITWHTEGVTPLTEAEVAAEVVRLEADADAAVVESAALRASAEAKLSALGLSVEEISTIIP
tara:strand:+ start:486 stop:746 length:261 start_codon:yes stop_codon:yes gene_type:complete